jgi:hypothetical protein
MGHLADSGIQQIELRVSATAVSATLAAAALAARATTFTVPIATAALTTQPTALVTAHSNARRPKRVAHGQCHDELDSESSLC